MTDRFDLKGLTPESWACVDCGINTAPGMPSRVEMERRYRTWAAINKLSGKNPSIVRCDPERGLQCRRRRKRL